MVTVRKFFLFLLPVILLLSLPLSSFAQDPDSDPVIEPLDPPEKVTVAYVPISKFAATFDCARMSVAIRSCGLI